MTQQDDVRRFAEAIIRNSGSHALNVVQQRVRLLEGEKCYSAAELWREVGKAIEKLQAIDRERGSD